MKSAVEAYTWDELSQISAEIGGAGDEAAAIEVAKRYNLCTPEGKLDGTQVKSVTLADGTQTTVQIVGFAHDDKTSGGKAGITFIFGDCVGQEPMNEEGTNEGGWEASPMRTYLNGTWRSAARGLDAVIVPVDKLTNNEGETKSAASVTSTSDSLWLPSVVELVGPIGDVYFGEEDRYRPVGDILNAEGSVYKLYRDAGVDTSGDNAILVKSGEGVSSYDDYQLHGGSALRTRLSIGRISRSTLSVMLSMPPSPMEPAALLLVFASNHSKGLTWDFWTT